jgi:DNA invertase Pin-like site-specific DNA recombinase
MTIRAAILARVSSAEQGLEGKVSIPDQVAACRAEIARRGWVEHDVYADVYTGTTLERPELGKILADAAQGNIQAVVATRVDRVARDLLDLLVLERDLRAHQIALVLTDFPVDTTTDLGRFSLQQMGAAAELELALIRRRTVAGKRGAVAKGSWPGGEPPFGFQVAHTIVGKHVDKHLEHNPAEVEATRAMVERLLDGQTPAEIARWLGAHGYAPRKAPRWTSQLVRKTLRRRTLIGELVYAKGPSGRDEPARRGGKRRHHASGEHGEPIAIQIPAILDAATFDAVQAQLAETGLGTRTDALVYLLSGRLTMPCGRLAQGWMRRDRRKGRNGYRLYRCSGVHRGACRCRQLDADQVEAAVWQAVAVALGDPTQVEQTVSRWQAAQPGNVDAGLLERRIATVRAALERAYVAGLTGGLDADALKAATTSLTDDLRVLERERDSAQAAKLEAAEVRRRARGLRELAARMDATDPRDRQQLMRLLDVRVTVSETGELQISGWLPFGPAETWDGDGRGVLAPSTIAATTLSRSSSASSPSRSRGVNAGRSMSGAYGG